MPHVVLNETSTVWRDSIDVIEAEDSKVYDFPCRFLANRRFRLIKAVQ